MSGASKLSAAEAGLAINRRLLANGIPVLVHENPTHHLVNLRFLVHAGSVEDTPAQAGLASFTGSSLLRGTERYAFEHINEVVDSTGMSIHTSAGTHLAIISLRCLTDDLPTGLELISDILCCPIFPDDEVTKLREQILTRIRHEQYSTRAVARRLFREAAYPLNHPYRLSPTGDQETVSAISRDDLAAAYHLRYGPARTFVVASGDVSSTDLCDLLATHVGNWQSLVSLVPEIPDAGDAQPSRNQREVAGKTQSDLVFGTLAFRRDHPEWEALRQATVIFGQLGLSGRLGAKVRDEQGLAYGVHANLESSLSRASWTVGAGVNPTNVDRALDSIRSELDKLLADGVTEDELAGAQRYLIGGMALQLETNSGITSVMQQIELFDLGLDYVEQRPKLIQAVTRDGILNTVRQHLPEGEAIISIAGPP